MFPGQFSRSSCQLISQQPLCHQAEKTLVPEPQALRGHCLEASVKTQVVGCQGKPTAPPVRALRFGRRWERSHRAVSRAATGSLAAAKSLSAWPVRGLSWPTPCHETVGGDTSPADALSRSSSAPFSSQVGWPGPLSWRVSGGYRWPLVGCSAAEAWRAAAVACSQVVEWRGSRTRAA